MLSHWQKLINAIPAYVSMSKGINMNKTWQNAIVTWPSSQFHPPHGLRSIQIVINDHSPALHHCIHVARVPDATIGEYVEFTDFTCKLNHVMEADILIISGDTGDGSDILKKTVEVGSLSAILFKAFGTSKGWWFLAHHFSLWSYSERLTLQVHNYLQVSGGGSLEA